MTRGLTCSAAVAAVLIAGGCGHDPVIGVLCPHTGRAAAYGRSVETGIDLALASAGNRGLLPPELAIARADSASSPHRATLEYRRLVSVDRARLVVGGVTSAEADALLPVVDLERVICLSPSASGTGLVERSRYFYRLYPSTEVEGATAARHLVTAVGARRVLVYSDGSLFTRGIESEFRQHLTLLLGGEVTDTIHVAEDGWQRRSVDALHAGHPQAVYVVGHAESILEVLEHLAANGFSGIRCTSSHLYLGEVLGRSSPAAEGALLPLAPLAAETVGEPFAGFAREYRAAYGVDPDVFAAHGYDAMRVAIRTLVASRRLNTAELRRVLSFDLGELAGVTGTIAFNERGEIARYPIMHIVWNGRVVPYAKLRQLQLEALQEALHELLVAPRPGTHA